jgi:predicted exporter/SAM-dependent methyltransferase
MKKIRAIVEGKGRYLIIFATLTGVGLAFWAGVERLKVNTDITAALPGNDPVVAAAKQILTHHPILENVFIQISMSGTSEGRDALVQAGDLVANTLQESSLVKVVSGKEGAGSFASLLEEVTDNLPLFFRSDDLEGRVESLIQPDRVEELLQEGLRQLSDLGSIGQAEYFAKDPLGLRNLVLARLSPSLPFKEAFVRQGHIISKDGQHLLLIAAPSQFSQDASFAHRMTEVLEGIARKLEAASIPGERSFQMSYTGAFRTSLDNERIIRRDTSRALTLVTIILIPLALLSFRRLWLGILSFVPAVAGTMLAVFVYAFTKDSIFAVTMGFGGALIGIAVDHGMAYVILLDRPFDTEGGAVAKEVWSVSSMTVISTVIALLSLMITGIPLFAELGLFSALGVGLSALFVHLFFPILFPRLQASRKEKTLLMERLVNWLVTSPRWWTVGGFAVFALVMIFFVKVQFSVDLASMNTVSKQTMEAEQSIEAIWGSLPRKPCIMVRGKSLERLWQEVERLGEFLRKEKDVSVLKGDLPRATLLPGPKAQEANLKAWEDFWTQERISALKSSLIDGGAKIGFKPEAFEPFFRTLQEPRTPRALIPKELFPFFGVFPERDRKEGWVFVDMITPGPGYQGEAFFKRAAQEGFLSFDSSHFSRHLARELNRSFIRMLLIVGGVTFVLLFFYFLDWQIFLLSIAPVSFSFVATLGTLGVLGFPLSIPSLMLAPLILGLGLDQGLYLVRSFQRYGSAPNPNSDAFRMTILVCSITTLIGFGSLLFSEHVVLRDAGVSSFLGIFYATAGAIGILPPVLRFLFAPSASPLPSMPVGSKQHYRFALRGYRHLEPYPRLFARFKMLMDPMFPRLADFVKPGWKVVDVGCGYGVPASWLLAVYPDLRFLACEPHEERARVAARVLGSRGTVLHCQAQALPLNGERADAVLLLDVLHYFSDPELREFLGRLRPVLSSGGRLIIRATIPGERYRLFRLVEVVRLSLQKRKHFFRSADLIRGMLEDTGFKVELVEFPALRREETWFIASGGIQSNL